jgi:dihydrofolate reductase
LAAKPAAHAPPLALIVAVAENGVIGRGDVIPWRLRDDQQFFKRVTTGHAMVMGRATWETFRRPLPGRTSVVLSRNPGFEAEGALVAHDFDAAVALAAAHPPAPGDSGSSGSSGDSGDSGDDARDETADDTVFVIGGAALYALALPRAEVAFVTRVHARVEGDVVFDAFSGAGPAGWERIAAEHHAADARNEHAFTIETWRRVD